MTHLSECRSMCAGLELWWPQHNSPPCSIAQLVSALDFNFERAVGGSILKVESEKSEWNNSEHKLTGLTW